MTNINLTDKNKKMLTTAGFALAGVLLVYFIFRDKKPTRIISGGGGNGGGGTPPPTPMTTCGTTIPCTQAEKIRFQKIANRIYTAMNWCGTDNSEIKLALNELNNEDDMKKLVDTYGTRTVEQDWFCGGGSYTGNILECLRDELSNGEIEDANNILRAKSITTLI